MVTKYRAHVPVIIPTEHILKVTDKPNLSRTQTAQKLNATMLIRKTVTLRLTTVGETSYTTETMLDTVENVIPIKHVDIIFMTNEIKISHLYGVDLIF